MREKTIELQLARAVKKIGGMCPKFVAPGTDGMPDRLVLLPGAAIGFVEVKAPGKEPRPLQVMRHRQLTDNDPEQIPSILAAIKGGSVLG